MITGKKFILCWMVIIIMVTIPALSWAWKVPGAGKLGKGKKASSSSGTTIGIAKLATEIHEVKKAFSTATKAAIEAKFDLLEMVGNKKEVAKLKDKCEQAQKIEDPQEKNAETSRINKATNEAIKNSVTEEKIKMANLSAEQKKILIKVFKNLTLATLKEKETLVRVQQLSKDAPPSLEAVKSNKMKAIKEAKNIKYVTSAASNDLPHLVKKIPEQIASIGSCLKSVTQLAKNNKVKLPKTKSVNVTDSFES